MALTPDDVVNQKFTITKFRDGYDLDQVDDFLDTIVEELRQHEAEKDELRAQIAELEKQLAACQESSSEERAEVTLEPTPEAPEPVSEFAPVASVPAAPQHESFAGATSDAVKSSSMLQLALELHDKYVSEGETKRGELVSEGEATAKRLVEEAQTQRADVLRSLADERDRLQSDIEGLREFESEYRTTLRSYIQAQLRNLDGSPEPGNKPGSVN